LFSHLICHSHFSFMRGTSSPRELCEAAARMGMKSLALTDVDGIYGAVWFWETARDAGVRPILGADVRADDGRAVLLVQNVRGYERLCHILTSRHLDEGFSLPRALVEDREGIAVLCADLSMLDAILNAGPPDNLYLALTPGADNRALLHASRERKVSPVATADAYMERPDQFEQQRMLRAIDLNTTVSRVPAHDMCHPAAWFTDRAEMERRFPNCPEAISNAARLAEECAMDRPPWEGLLFPDYDGIGESEAFRLLRSRCLAGARRRYGKGAAKVRARLDRELAVIRDKGFATYFLVVEDIVRRFPITCGRGSAAASIVSYCLMITHVEPIRHRLFFERFLNPGRKDPPDIDVDFPWDTRDDALDYVFEKYARHVQRRRYL
jgi:error-prone DNA polymerase